MGTVLAYFSLCSSTYLHSACETCYNVFTSHIVKQYVNAVMTVSYNSYELSLSTNDCSMLKACGTYFKVIFSFFNLFFVNISNWHLSLLC